MKIFKSIAAMFTAATLAAMTGCDTGTRASERDVHLKIIQTTDVHGNFFPIDFINRIPNPGSLARVSTFVKELRDSIGRENVILLDNGDILQGQPSAYYYNYIDTEAPHLAARMLNYLDYDAFTIGNHDIETGHAVYDRFSAQLNMPVLAANVIDKSTGNPYFRPYTVIERNGIRIAVLGLITPAIPAWLPENLWKGLEFEDMETAARKWMKLIRKKEKPDLIIGLFHSGHDSSVRTGGYNENASVTVVENVAGFDAVFIGHDHIEYLKEIVTKKGDKVIVLNPANGARKMAELSVDLKINGHKIREKKITGKIVSVTDVDPDQAFLDRFEQQRDAITDFVSKKIGTAAGDFNSRDSFFGPSAFMSLLHSLQLEIGEAEISFAAPLSFDATIAKGDIHMSDMFNLYKYENMLYTMELTGKEIKDYLEESYSMWTQQMNSASDHLLLFADETGAAKGGYARLKNPSYNFDSAAGINYTVDVTKPKGSKINITSMTDGTPFSMTKKYRVALNSYRGNGGGDHLTKGAGIPQSDLKSRILKSTDKDLRFYLLKAIEKKGTVAPAVELNWRFIPESMADSAIRRDRKILFGK